MEMLDKSAQADLLTIEEEKIFLHLWGFLLLCGTDRIYILTGAVWRQHVHFCLLPLKNAFYFSPGRRERQCYVRGGILEAAVQAGHRNCAIFLPGWAVSSHIWWRKREERPRDLGPQ